jgi:hypothetical protein
VSNQVSHPYKITGKVAVLHILIFTFLNRSGQNVFESVGDFVQQSCIEAEYFTVVTRVLGVRGGAVG